MNNRLDMSTDGLKQTLQRLKAQVLETRDNPAPNAPGQISVREVFEAAEDARHSMRFQP